MRSGWVRWAGWAPDADARPAAGARRDPLPPRNHARGRRGVAARGPRAPEDLADPRVDHDRRLPAAVDAARLPDPQAQRRGRPSRRATHGRAHAAAAYGRDLGRVIPVAGDGNGRASARPRPERAAGWRA